MGNILSYNRQTNELVARNSTPTQIVRYIYKFTLYNVNFSNEHMYYISSDWSVSSTGSGTGSHRDVTFTYIGSGGETGNKYYTLNLSPYKAFKIAQFARLADLTVNDTNFDFETRFTWVSKQSLDGVTENDDEYDTSEGDLISRDYSITFVNTINYIENLLVEYKANLGEIYVDNTSVGMTSLYQVCIRNVNPIGSANYYSKSIKFDFINSAWNMTTSEYDDTKLDYFFTYKGNGNKYLFSSGNRFMLAKFSLTVNEESSNINTLTHILTLEEPLDSGNILNKTIIDKIHVNTVNYTGIYELPYDIKPLRYYMSQALIDQNSTQWSEIGTDFNSLGLRALKIFKVNLNKDGMLPKTYLKDEDVEVDPDNNHWTFSDSVNADDSDYNDITMTYTGDDSAYGFNTTALLVFFKLIDRTLAISNLNDLTFVELTVAYKIGESGITQYYDMSGYLFDIYESQTVEYLGCPKMLNYNPMSGLFKLNGVLDNRISKLKTFTLIGVNLYSPGYVTDSSKYAGTITNWSLTSSNQSTIADYNDLTIMYDNDSYTITSSVEHICKFYKVSNDLFGSEINANVPVRIPLADILGSSFTGDTYIDLITVNPGVEYWSSGTGYLEYTKSQALFSVEPDASDYALPTIKKFIIENVNANELGVYGPETLTNWTITSVENGSNYNLIAEYTVSENPKDPFTLSTVINVFLLTRTAKRYTASNIDESTEIRVYMNYDKNDDEENYFADVLALDYSTEYIGGTPVIEYSKYDGTFKLLKNSNLKSVDSIEFFDVNVDHNTSIYTNSVTGTITSSASTGSAAFDITFPWTSPFTLTTTGDEFVRFNRLGSGVTMNDLSDSNISDTTVFRFIGTDVGSVAVNAYLSLISVSDPSEEEYYSKRNYIEYYANLGELRLRRSILNTIYAVEIVAIDVNNVHFVNPSWTASSALTTSPGGGSSGEYDLRLEYEPNNNRIVRYDDITGNISIDYPNGGSDVKKIYKFVLKSVNTNVTNVSTDWTVSSVGVGVSVFDVTFAYKPSGIPAIFDLGSTQLDIATLSILKTLSNNTIIQIWDETASDIPVIAEQINNDTIVRYNDNKRDISINYHIAGSSVNKIYKFVLKSVGFQATDVSVNTSAANAGWTVSSVGVGVSVFDVTFAYKPSGIPAIFDLGNTQLDIATLSTLSNNTLIQIWDETASDIPVTEETFYNGPYVFPTNDGTEDDYVRLCTFYYNTTLSGINTEVTQVRLYIKDALESVETENVIDKIGQENSTTENGVNYYMKTGTMKLNQSLLGEEFRNLHRLVFYGVNVNAACIYSRTFTQIAAWTVTTQQNFYNSDYVDLIITYNGATDYIVAGEVFLFQFFDTINRTFENAGLIYSKSSGSAKDAPVTWYSTRDIVDQDYDTSPTAISGYFIGNEDGGIPGSYEYYSENARIFKYYNNRGVTQILGGVSSRIAKVKNVTLLDVNFSRSQIYPAGTGLGITVDSEDAAVYQDFSIIFNSAHDVTKSSGSDKELITVYDFYDVNLVDYLMNNDTIALVTIDLGNDETTTFPIRTISAENAEYYKMDGIINYYGNNGDINFMNKSYGGLNTSGGVYKIEMENVNATTNEVIIVYGSWTVTSTRVGSLYTLRFEYSGIGNNDTFIQGENFINIALLLGYYSSIYGSSLINKDTIVTVTFDKDKTSVDDIAKGKLVRLVSDPTEYDVTFTDRKKYPVPTNLYTRYKEYNFLFLTGDGRKNGKNTCISVFSRTVLTGITGKTIEAVFEASASKVQMVRYTVLKSKTAPYDFSCEESGYTSFDVDSRNIDLGTIGIRFEPQRNIPSNYPAISLMKNTLGGGKHTMYEIMDSVIVVTISKYNGTNISSQVKKILEIYGTNFNSFNLKSGDCYMCVLFVNRKFETPKDLATLSSINQSDFVLSQRERNTVVYENSSNTKLVIVIPYAQMSAYMKYHYESVRNIGNTVRLPNVMLLNAERTLNNYRKNALVYDVNVLS